MEIERKFRIKYIPIDLETYPYLDIEQGYLCRKPTLRIRKSNEDYYLTYKNKKTHPDSVAIVNEEVELPLNKKAFEKLRAKIDGRMVKKFRYVIPLQDGLKAELDVFKDYLEGLVYVEVEFPSEGEASGFVPPDWFGEDISMDARFSNGHLSTIDRIPESFSK